MKAAKIAIIIFIVFAVTAAAVLAVIGIPVGFLAKAVEARIEAATGYRLQVEGISTLALWPSTTVVVRNITLSDPTGAKSPDVISAESVKASVSLSGLVNGHPLITELVVVHPTMRVLLRRERAPKTASAQSDSGSGSAAEAQNFPLERVAVEDGTVVMVNPINHAESRIEHITLNASFAASNGPFDIVAQAQWGDQPLKLQLKGEGAISAARTVPVQLSFDAPDLLQDALAGSADVKLTGSTLTIDQLNGTVSRGRFGGQLSMDLASKPLIKADLDFQRLNLLAANAAAGTGASGSDLAPASSSPGSPWSDRQTDLDALKFFDADVKISIAEFNYGTFRAAPASVQATVAGGTLTAQFPRLGLYGGQAEGTLLVDASDAEPNHALRVNLTGVRALPLLTDLAEFSSVDGRLQAKIDVHAAGASPRGLISTLGGSADVLVQDGEVRGINVAKMVRELMGTTLTGWQASRAEKTDLSELRALFRLSNGQATTRNLQMLGPLVRMTGQGSADLNAKTLDFKLEPKLVMTLEGQGGAANPAGLGVPVVVQGPWSEPRIYPDVAGILDNPDAAFDKLRQLGGALFGNKGGSGGGLEAQIPGLGNFFGRGNARNDGSKRTDSGNNPAATGKNANPRDPQTPNLDGIIRDLFGR